MPRYDEADIACMAWARRWAEINLRSPILARDYLGRLSCTLGRRRDLHSGATTNVYDAQQWPEVFLGNALVVAVALQYCTLLERDVLAHHFIARRFDLATGEVLPRVIAARQMAVRMGIKQTTYSHRLTMAKTWIHTALSTDEKKLAMERLQAY